MAGEPIQPSNDVKATALVIANELTRSAFEDAVGKADKVKQDAARERAKLIAEITKTLLAAVAG